ncbi:MAG: arsenite efflux transporter metallochaperone ArsD [Clostridium sp.]|nr:arsenite efflux transporter metallochaperone ArsD [Clostridium sp.]
MKEVTIEYLYLDLKTCDRCVGTDEVLDEVLDVLEPTLKLAGYKIVRRKIEMSTVEIANEYQFLSSPTIRINDKDIFLSVEENDCGQCSDIAGCDVECRVFRYEDEVYEIPPKEMLANAILKTLFSDNINSTNTEYIMPENLKEFYASKNSNGDSNITKISIYEAAMCCETGVCGVGVDPELLRISTVLSNLKKHGVVVNRYNLSNAPQEFIENQVINKLIMGDGVESLPATVVDGKIVMTKKYPTNAEISELFGVPKSYLGEEKKPKADGCCNGGGCC